MAKLDIKRLVKSSLERVKQSEHIPETDPSIVHLEENVVRSIAELEVKRAQPIRSNPEPSQPASGDPGAGSPTADDQPKTSRPSPRRAA